jgi:hypothetical protein
MKIPKLVTCLTLVIALMTGCSTYRVFTCSVSGDRVIMQPTYEVKASVVRIVHYGNTFAFPEDLNGANAFMFDFIGITNEVRLGASSGTYQYDGKQEKSLDLPYLSSNRAVFIPKPDEIQSERLKSGLYKLTIQSTIDTQKNTNNFQIEYKIKYKIKWVFFWDLIGVSPHL